jgi:hypothetical protein
MILSGFETHQNYHLNNINFLNDSTNLHYNLSNRVDSDGNIIQWGDSVIIGFDNTIGTAITTGNIKIFDLRDIIEWEVLNSSDHWVIIANKDTTGNIYFNDYFNDKKTSKTESNKLSQGGIVRYIRKNEISKNYKNLNVKMKALDTLIDGAEFGSMNMKVDLNGMTIIYNLSLSFYIELEEKNIHGTLFDLCIDTEDYQPIIRGLKFVEKIRDLDYLIFSHYTNKGKEFIIFTTRTNISEYAIYPDTHITDNLYNNIANDYRVPALFNNMMNDIYSTEFIDLYANADSIDEEILTSKLIYCKEVRENDVIYYNSISGDVESTHEYVVLPEYPNPVVITGTLSIIANNGKLFLLSNNVDEIKKFNLNNLMITISTPIDSSEKNFRSIQVYYDDSVGRKELLYQSYLSLITIFPNESKTFRIIL